MSLVAGVINERYVHVLRLVNISIISGQQYREHGYIRKSTSKKVIVYGILSSFLIMTKYILTIFCASYEYVTVSQIRYYYKMWSMPILKRFYLFTFSDNLLSQTQKRAPFHLMLYALSGLVLFYVQHATT